MANTMSNGKMTITLDLTSLDQLRAVEAALEIYVDMESDRSKSKDAGWSKADAARLAGAKQVLALLGTSA